jgi:hypothetical protein
LAPAQPSAKAQAPAPKRPKVEDDSDAFTRGECFKSGFQLTAVVLPVGIFGIPVLGWIAALPLFCALLVPGLIVGALFAATKTYKGGI